eukprot:COSAG05_NODE_14053_length_409_cov_1.329032_2_plen_65_part_00
MCVATAPAPAAAAAAGALLVGEGPKQRVEIMAGDEPSPVVTLQLGVGTFRLHSRFTPALHVFYP